MTTASAAAETYEGLEKRREGAHKEATATGFQVSKEFRFLLEVKKDKL